MFFSFPQGCFCCSKHMDDARTLFKCSQSQNLRSNQQATQTHLPIPAPPVSVGPAFREEEGEGGVVHHVFSFTQRCFCCLECMHDARSLFTYSKHLNPRSNNQQPRPTFQPLPLPFPSGLSLEQKKEKLEWFVMFFPFLSTASAARNVCIHMFTEPELQIKQTNNLDLRPTLQPLPLPFPTGRPLEKKKEKEEWFIMFFPSLSAASAAAAAQNVCMMHDLSSHVHSSGTLLTANIEEDSPLTAE